MSSPRTFRMILIWVGVGLLMLGAFSFLGICIAKFATVTYEIRVNKYELLRDILGIILTAIAIGVAIFGTLAYLMLRQTLQAQATAAAKTEMTRGCARLLNYIGYVYWIDYTAKKIPYEYLKQAIELTELAYTEHAKKLIEHENELLICSIKNNLAYYIAERQKFPKHARPEDKKIAQEHATYIYSRLSKFPEQREAWWDTCQHVLKQFALSEKDLQEVKS